MVTIELTSMEWYILNGMVEKQTKDCDSGFIKDRLNSIIDKLHKDKPSLEDIEFEFINGYDIGLK